MLKGPCCYLPFLALWLKPTSVSVRSRISVPSITQIILLVCIKHLWTNQTYMWEWSVTIYFYYSFSILELYWSLLIYYTFFLLHFVILHLKKILKWDVGSYLPLTEIHFAGRCCKSSVTLKQAKSSIGQKTHRFIMLKHYKWAVSDIFIMSNLFCTWQFLEDRKSQISIATSYTAEVLLATILRFASCMFAF